MTVQQCHHEQQIYNFKCLFTWRFSATSYGNPFQSGFFSNYIFITITRQYLLISLDGSASRKQLGSGWIQSISKMNSFRENVANRLISSCSGFGRRFPSGVKTTCKERLPGIRVPIVKNEHGGSATQQELRSGGVGVTMERTGELGVNPPPPLQFEPCLTFRLARSIEILSG